MRLFVALQIPAAVRENIAAVRDKFRNPQSQMRWVRPENFHVTLKFIGQIPSENVELISGALRAVRADRPVELRFCGLHWYWNAKEFGMLWATMEAVESLTRLAIEIDRHLNPLGIPPEDRNFVPHLTLARCKHPEHRKSDGIPRDIRAVADEYNGHIFGSLRAEEFHLIESQLGAGGSKYSTVASFPFVQAANA